MSRTRTRFAPSPTGFIHLGNIRSALYPWAFARATGGDFILRIEDTDEDRSTQAAVDVILEGMRWLGLNVDPFAPPAACEAANPIQCVAEKVDSALTHPTV